MTDIGEFEHFLIIWVTRARQYMQLDQTMYALKYFRMFATFLGPTQKLRKYPLPSNAVDRIAQEQGELLEKEQRWLDNIPYRSLLSD